MATSSWYVVIAHLASAENRCWSARVLPPSMTDHGIEILATCQKRSRPTVSFKPVETLQNNTDTPTPISGNFKSARSQKHLLINTETSINKTQKHLLIITKTSTLTWVVCRTLPEAERSCSEPVSSIWQHVISSPSVNTSEPSSTICIVNNKYVVVTNMLQYPKYYESKML